MRLALPRLSADDIFISYSRRDGNTYAAGLADELTRRGFSCFFDKLGTDADRNLPPSLTGRIRSCAMLVVIGSPAASASRFVAQEVEEFAGARGTSRAVPIYFGAPDAAGGWQDTLVGIAPEVEDSAALESGNPSPAVVNRIEKSFNYVRSKDRLRRYTVGASVTLVLLVLASLAAALVARNQFAQARLARAQADSAKADARQQTERAEFAGKEATTAIERAKAETARAGKAEDDARRAQDAAATATSEAKHQQQLAASAGERAKEERAKADREAQNARASGLVSIARGMANGDPVTASLLLTEANGPSEPEDGVATARELLAHYVTKVVLRGHEKPFDELVGIHAAAFNPDGTRVVTAGGDGTARVWTNDRRAQAVVLGGDGGRRGSAGAVTTAGFSPDGTRVVTASRTGPVRVWRADGSGSPVVLSERGREVQGAQFSPDGRRLLVYGGRLATIEPADGSPGAIELPDPESVTSAAFSPDGTRVFTGSLDGNGRIWNAFRGGEPVVLRGGGGSVIVGTFSPDGKTVAVGSLNGGARIRRVDGVAEPVLIGKPTAQVQVVSFSADGTKVALMPFGESVEIRPVSGAGPPVRIPPPAGIGGPAHTIRFNKSGTRVLISWHNGTAEVWNADGTGTPVVLRGHARSLSEAAFSPDEREIVTASYDGTARIWTRASREDPVVLLGEPNFRARFSPDGRRVVAVARWRQSSGAAAPARDHEVLVWNADGTGTPLVLRGHLDGSPRRASAPTARAC